MRRIFKINVGLLSIADNSVPVSPGCGDGIDRWIGTVAGRVDPQGFAEMTLLSVIITRATELRINCTTSFNAEV